MSDDEEAAQVKRSNDRWIVLALTISAFLLAWLLKNHLDSIHEIRERHREIDREIDSNLPKEQAPAALGKLPPGHEAATIAVLDLPDGSTRVRFEGSTWALPAASHDGHEISRQRLQEQLTERLTAFMTAHGLHRVELYVDPPPRKGKPVTGTMLVLDIVLAAGISDVVFASEELPEVPR